MIASLLWNSERGYLSNLRIALGRFRYRILRNNYTWRQLGGYFDYTRLRLNNLLKFCDLLFQDAVFLKHRGHFCEMRKIVRAIGFLNNNILRRLRVRLRRDSVLLIDVTNFAIRTLLFSNLGNSLTIVLVLCWFSDRFVRTSD